MLIDPAKLVRDRAARWAAIDSLRLPSGRGADGRGVSAATLKSVLRFVESKEGNNGKEWHSLPHMAEIMGLKGTKTLERALYALRMMGLLSINDTSRGGKRCLEKSINWQRVFRDEPIFQASVPLCLCGELLDSDDVDSDTTTRGFRHSVGTDYDTNTPQTDPECRNPTICSIIKQTSIQTSTEPGEWMGGDFDDFKREEDFTTETPRHGEASEEPAWGRDDLGEKAGSSLAREQETMTIAAPGYSVPRCLRGVPAPDSRPPAPDYPMASRVIHPGERDLIARLVSLGVSAAQVTVRHAFRAGYSIEQINGILDWYEGHGLADPSNPGQKVFPYAPGQLVRRLQDPYGIVDRAGQTLDPALGNWAGGKYGVWTSLKAQAVAAEKLGQPVAVPPKPAALVALESSSPSAVVGDESKAELDQQIDNLSHAEALDLLEPGSIVRTVAQRKWLPGTPMPGMVRTALRKRLVADGPNEGEMR